MSAFNSYRPGRINLLWLMLGSGGAAIAVLIGLLFFTRHDRSTQTDGIKVYCAAGLRPAMEDIAKKYKEEYGLDVEFQFEGSNSLLNKIQVNKFDDYDLYLAADDFYTDQAVEKGLAVETLPIAYMRPVVAVKKDSELNIASFDDLLDDGVRVAMGNPEQAAIGRAVRKRLSSIKDGDTDRWQQLNKQITSDGVFKPTVNDTANDVNIGAVDAAIVWDSTVAMPEFRDKLRAVPLPELDGDPNLVSICVLNSSQKPTAALKFARYVTAIDRGLGVFEEFGTRPVEDGDVWAERPEITFFCGAVNRLAVESILADFQAREGVEINTTYNGCGILTSQMKTIQDQRVDLGFPDAYMACDVYYLENVKDWFQDAANVSDTQIVIAVPKGSDKVKSLEDLAKPGVRVSIGEPNQCTIGALTRRLLVQEGLYDAIKKKQLQEGETVVEKPSSALLVPDVVAGHVDATIAYITDVRPNLDRVDVVQIDSPLNVAIQPFGISKSSHHKYLCRRLFKRIAASPEAFEDVGFHFRLRDDDADAQDAAPSLGNTK